MGMGSDFNVYSSRTKTETQLERYAKIEHMDPEYLVYSVTAERRKQRKINRALFFGRLKDLVKRLFQGTGRAVASSRGNSQSMQGCTENCD